MWQIPNTAFDFLRLRRGNLEVFENHKMYFILSKSSPLLKINKNIL